MYISTTLQLFNWHTGYLRTHRVPCPGNSFPMLSNSPCMKTCSFLFHILPFRQNCQILLFLVKRLCWSSVVSTYRACATYQIIAFAKQFFTYILCALTPHEDLLLSISYCTVSMQDTALDLSNKTFTM